MSSISRHLAKCLVALSMALCIASSCQARSLSSVEIDDSLDVNVDSIGSATWSPMFCNQIELPSFYYGKDFHPGQKRLCKGKSQPATCPVTSATVGYINLMRSNDTYGSGTFGMMQDVNGQDVWRVLPSSVGAAFAAVPADAGGYSFSAGAGYGKFRSYSNSPDIPTLHVRGKDIYMVNHFEYSQPASMYISKLTQDAATGKLTVTSTEAIKDGPGTWFACSGTITPWDSHLGSEEYPPDCRIYEETVGAPTCKAATDYDACGWVSQSGGDSGGLAMARHVAGWGVHPISEDDVVNKTDSAVVNFEKALGFGNQAKIDEFKSKFNCYNYGGSPEVAVGLNGKYQYKKWWTLGRISHESAIVMPDLKTVYTTDDGTNCGFFMFKADKKADLSRGKLYAAKWTQDGAADNFKVSWILLGSANQYELEKLVAKKPKFTDIFETAEPESSSTCPDGFKAANTPLSKYLRPQTPAAGQSQAFIECLKVKPGMEKAAAFLETRRYAAMLGATTEFEKEEGITHDPVTNQLYVAYTRIAKGMVADAKFSAGQPGDVNMPENRCGAVFAYSLDKQYTATSAKAILYGKPLPAADADGNKCALDGIANPDNLHFINGVLLIAEDTSDHLNNVLWSYDVAAGQLTRILSSPRLAEVTGIYISYVNQYAYLALAMQHPEEDTPLTKITLPIAQSQRSYVGYIGPLSAGCLKAGKKPVFAGIPAAKTPAEKSAVLVTTSVEYK